MPNCLLPDFFPAKCGNQRQGSASAAPDIAVTWGAWHLWILEIGENWGPSGPAKSCSNDCDSLIITEKQVFLMQFSQPHLPIGPRASHLGTMRSRFITQRATLSRGLGLS